MKKRTKILLSTLLILVGLGMLGAAGWMWFDANVDRGGWVLEEDGRYSYRDFHGKPISGWLTLEDRVCYFDEAFRMVTGWQNLGGNRYYFGNDGVLATGWKELEGKTYFFAADGVLTIGWKELEGKRFYFDAQGAMVTDWRTIDGTDYYFLPEGAMATGWQELPKGHYFFDENGVYLTGVQIMEDGERFFRADGTMVTDWLERDGETYHYGLDGLKDTLWQEIEGSLYYFSEEGVMQTGWHEEEEYRYYLREDGKAAVGPVELEDGKHFFTPKGIHVVLVNRDNPIPRYYETDVVVAEDYHQVQRVALEPLTRMLADCRAAVESCVFNSAYRTYKQQKTILETRTEEYMDKGMTYEEAYAETLKTVSVPGTSEHQLGLAVDLVGKEANAWLAEHCWEYGFILRYPEGKKEITGIINEPWHFRYVGTRVSLDMKDTGLCLEEYLGAA